MRQREAARHSASHSGLFVGQLCIAHAHKLLFFSLRSKFWRCH